jgi:hypothetical protein
VDLQADVVDGVNPLKELVHICDRHVSHESRPGSVGYRSSHIECRSK